jgi:hypothetical protein
VESNTLGSYLGCSQFEPSPKHYLLSGSFNDFPLLLERYDEIEP